MDMSMSMSSSPSSTMSMTAASSSGASSMGGMDMGPNACKISMTWNWYTVGACFISKSWQVTSGGMFAGSCIGVICLVISLEFLRRCQREYEGFLRRQDQKACRSLPSEQSHQGQLSSGSSENSKTDFPVTTSRLISTTVRPPTPARATLLQRQLVRSLLHMLQFGVAYFIMLLAMYYNGYIIICILIGAFLGAFFFSWDQLQDNTGKQSEAADVTGCCG